MTFILEKMVFNQKAKKKYIKLFVIGIFLILLVGTLGIVSSQEQTTLDIDKGFNIKTWFQKTFGIQTYSIVGDYRQCARYPGVTLYIDYRGTIPKASTYYTNSLTDVFDQQWNALGEWKDSPDLGCDDRDGCIAEYYQCPYPECTSDSKCSSWYGSGSECKTHKANDPNIEYQSGSSFKYCTEPSGLGITCYYYSSGNSCSTRTYMGDITCPATYMGYKLYSSRSACEATIPVTPTCSDGIQNQGETGVDCGGPCNACDGGAVEKGDIRLNGEVSVGAPSLGGGPTTIKVPLKNFGTKEETINLEAGFYSPNYATEVARLYSTFPLFSSVPAPNCNPAEEFVKTKKVTILPGKSETVEISVNPYSSFVTYDVGTHDLRTEPPVWFAGLYKQCLGGYTNEAGTTGKAVMFDYGEYSMQCPLSLFGSDILCGGEKSGTCKVNTFEITNKCEITSTVDVVNGTDPSASITKTNLISAKKLSLTKDVISKSTSQELLASSCLTSSECILVPEDMEDYTSSCTSIAKLRSDEILTETDTNNLFKNAKTITKGAVYGAAGGVVACLIAAGPIFALGPGAFLASPAILGGCAAVGVLFGGVGTSIFIDLTHNDKLLDYLQAENANAVGICTKESKSNLDSYFKWAAFFDVTGDGNKDGTDGLIIVVVLGALLLVILRK